MIRKQYLIIGAVAFVIAGINAKAASVNFIEGAEGANVTINASGYTGVGIPPSSTVGPESATYTGYQIGNFGTGSYTVGLFESVGGPLSDYVKVSWSYGGFIGISAITQFKFDFKSDVEGQTLLPPAGGFNVTAVETGQLQTFQVPSQSFNLSVGIQSDVEPKTVPDGGSTVALFGFGLTGILLMNRSRTKNS